MSFSPIPFVLACTMLSATSTRLPDRDDDVVAGMSESPRYVCAGAASGVVSIIVFVEGCFGGGGYDVALEWTPHDAIVTSSLGARQLEPAELAAFHAEVADIVTRHERSFKNMSTLETSAAIEWDCDDQRGSLPMSTTFEHDPIEQHRADSNVRRTPDGFVRALALKAVAQQLYSATDVDRELPW